jgi:hypothetical protein
MLKKVGQTCAKQIRKPKAGRSDKSEPVFVQVPLRWGRRVTAATNSPAALAVVLELMRRRYRALSTTFALPNAQLYALGVSVKAKRRVLRDLESAGLIAVENRPGKSPLVTLLLGD